MKVLFIIHTSIGVDSGISRRTTMQRLTFALTLSQRSFICRSEDSNKQNSFLIIEISFNVIGHINFKIMETEKKKRRKREEMRCSRQEETRWETDETRREEKETRRDEMGKR